MYQSNMLVKDGFNKVCKAQQQGLILNDDDKQPLPFYMDDKLRLIGSYEVAPIVMGLIATDNIGYLLFPFDYTVIGVLISSLILYIFRNDVPDQPISLGHAGENEL